MTRRTMFTGAAAVGAASVTAALVPALAEAEDAAALPLIGPVAAPGVHAMTFNLRVGVDEGERSWESRLPSITTFLTQEHPAILGTQEGELDQIDDLKQALSGYGCVSKGREADGGGETCAIFYDEQRLEAADSGHLWLSDTPEEPGSTSWGNTLPRMLTWVRFTDLDTGKEFVHVNTHFDHQSANARERSATMVRELALDFGVGVVITGDFNAPSGSQPHKTLTEGDMHDSWNWEEARVTELSGTFNGWDPQPDPDGDRIDWVLGTGEVSVDKVGINTWVPDSGDVASDHWAVQAVVTLA